MPESSHLLSHLGPLTWCSPALVQPPEPVFASLDQSCTPQLGHGVVLDVEVETVEGPDCQDSPLEVLMIHRDPTD
jgi:hypothetical protein